MKKILTTLALLVATTILLAQAPQKFSYQGVIRDAAGNLVRNAPVGVRVSLLKASAEGVAVYCETHHQTTNANGLLTLTIGDGTVVGGDMAAIDWADGPYFLKTETDITGGSNYTLVGAQQLLSVPYALYAGNTTNAFSGDYNDLSNKPEIPEVPTEVSAFTNDAGYISNKECDSLSYCQLLAKLSMLQKKIDALSHNNESGSNSDTLDMEDRINRLEKYALFPEVITDSIIIINCSAADVMATIVNAGARPVVERGVCWSITQNPSLSDEYVPLTGEVGSFNVKLLNLIALTTYYVRPYVTTNLGTFYGDEFSFTTPPCDGQPCANNPSILDADGNKYNTVQIGGQCWMKENLRTTKYADGTIIEQGSTTSQKTACWHYPNDISLTETIGLFYNKAAVLRESSYSNSIPSGIQGICPTGWHVPSRKEWNQLIDYVSSQNQYLCNGSYVCKSLASTQGWKYSSSECAVGYNQNYNNATKFSAFPTVSPTRIGTYTDGEATFFWTSSHGCCTDDYPDYYSRAWGFTYEGTIINNVTAVGPSTLISVRCLRDE